MPETNEKPGRAVNSHAPARHCAHCGAPIPHGGMQSALVVDSSVIDPEDFHQDGVRVVSACSEAHLQELIQQARSDWVEEELWFGRLCRASRQARMREAPLWRVAEQARLSPEHLVRALDWNSRTTAPLTVLPGGHALPPHP